MPFNLYSAKKRLPHTYLCRCYTLQYYNDIFTGISLALLGSKYHGIIPH